MFDCLNAATSIAVLCCVLMLALLKFMFSSECNAIIPKSQSSNLRPITTCCVVLSALAFIANSAFILKSRSKSASTLAKAFCSKWQPCYLIVVSASRLILRAIVIVNSVSTSSKGAWSCILSAEYENQMHAAAFIWNCVTLLNSVSTMSCDLDADYTPKTRRLTYGMLSGTFAVDTISSVIWGNVMAHRVSVYVFDLKTYLDSQITSISFSQTIISLHLLFVSCKSRHGRGWAYASLRFELDEYGKAFLSGRALRTEEPAKLTSTTNSSALMPMLEPEASDHTRIQPATPLGVFSRLHRRFTQFQTRHSSLCRAFVIPCVANPDASENAEFVLARPAFDVKLLQPLQRLADKFPKFYIIVLVFCLAFPSILCYILLTGAARAVSNCVLNSCMVVVFLGFLSSRRHGLDKVAVKHVITSFRFAYCLVLHAGLVVLKFFETFLPSDSTEERLHPLQPFSFVISTLLFFESALLDCSPHLSKSSHLLMAVMCTSEQYQTFTKTFNN
jgi:hypothetical protein